MQIEVCKKCFFNNLQKKKSKITKSFQISAKFITTEFLLTAKNFRCYTSICLLMLHAYLVK